MGFSKHFQPLVAIQQPLASHPAAMFSADRKNPHRGRTGCATLGESYRLVEARGGEGRTGKDWEEKFSSAT